MKYLIIKNWEKFQHYKDRNPPWIKLHFEILSSRDWVMFDDASRALAIAIMLIASKDGGQIPYDEPYLCRMIYRDKIDLNPLINSGFLEVLAERKHMQAEFRPEKEAEKRQRREDTRFLKKGGLSGKEKPTSKEVIERMFKEERILDA